MSDYQSEKDAMAPIQKGVEKSLPIIAKLAELAFFAGSLPVEMVFRYRFGRRYLGIVTLLLSLLAPVVYMFLYATIAGPSAASSGSVGFFSTLWFIATIALYFGHKLHSTVEVKAGKRWHSYCSGLSWPVWGRLPVRPDLVHRFLEPGSVIVLGLILMSIHAYGGGQLVFAGIAWMIKEHFAYLRAYDRVLDMMDAQIEAENLQAVMVELKPPSMTAGFGVPGPKPRTEAERRRLADRFRQSGGAVQVVSRPVEPGTTRTADQAHPQGSKQTD